MTRALTRVDQFLRGAGPFRLDAAQLRPWWWLPAMMVCFSPIYGAVMGSYRVGSGDRLLLLAYAGVKLPLLLGVTTLLCLPGFFVLNTVLGLRDHFRESVQAILAGQAGLAVALASLAPLTRVWYFSTADYRAAILFNAALFTVATSAGHVVMLRFYRELIRRNRRHRLMLYGWVLLYSFVGIQTGWMLRPFVGSPNMPVTFFRQEPFSNAYIHVLSLIFGG